MKLIKGELKNKIWTDVHGKVLEHVPYDSPVRDQIQKNFGWMDNDSLFRLKINDLKNNIGNDLDETT